MSDRRTYIYALTDPRDGLVRYVGKAIDPDLRYRAHLLAADTPRMSAKGRWIRELRAAGLEPSLEILDTTTGDGHQLERQWIARTESLFLTNVLRVAA